MHLCNKILLICPREERTLFHCRRDGPKRGELLYYDGQCLFQQYFSYIEVYVVSFIGGGNLSIHRKQN